MPMTTPCDQEWDTAKGPEYWREITMIRSFSLTILVLAQVFASASSRADTLAAIGGSAPNLGFEERVHCQEMIENIYWAHTNWPDANPLPKPRRDQVLSNAQLVAQVERQFLHEAALAHVWNDPLTPEPTFDSCRGIREDVIQC
jgi:hypothetical protein